MKGHMPKSDFKPAPSGAHPAILIQLIDLGSHEETWEGKTKQQPKVRLVFELHSEEAVVDGKPMTVGRDFTLSSHENARLRQFIEGWRGAAFSDEEAAAFDYKVMLGKPCILNVTHTKKADRTYANFESASRLIKGMASPVQANPSIYFSMQEGEFDTLAYGGLPDWLKEKIAKSPEYAALTGKPVAEPAAATSGNPAAGAIGPFEDSEIPF